jgi:hypothetical protein
MVKERLVEILYEELKWDRTLIEENVEFILSKIDISTINELANNWDNLNHRVLTCEKLVGRYHVNFLYILCHKLAGKYIETIKTDFETLTKNIKIGDFMNM